MDIFKTFRIKDVPTKLEYTDLVNISRNRWKFNITTNNDVLANDFLRIMGWQLPSFAIGNIEIETNTSYILDETIALRVGLIPVTAKIDVMEKIKDVDLDPADNTDCFETFVIDAECPSNSNRPTIITSNDLVAESYPSIFDVLDNDIFICTLNPGQELRVRGIVQIGSGSYDTFYHNHRNHPKWNPVVKCIRMFNNENNDNDHISMEIETLGNVDVNKLLNMGIKYLSFR